MMEERRRENDKFFGELSKFMDESRIYRAKDEVLQKYQAENIEGVKNAVLLQNGRVVKLEKWQIEIEQRIKQRKDNYATVQAWITVIATFIMGVAAWITIFKK